MAWKSALAVRPCTWWILFSFDWGQQRAWLFYQVAKGTLTCFKDPQRQVHKDVTLNWFEGRLLAESLKEPQKNLILTNL